MTNTNVTNFSNLIEIESFKFYSYGLKIVYNLFGNQHILPAFTALESAQLLREVDFISDYTGAGNEVAVEYERLETFELVQQHWSDFIRECGFDKDDALSVASYIEAKKQAEREAKVFSDAKETMLLSIVGGLSSDQIDCWRELKKVKSNTPWGHAIRLVRSASDISSIKQLLEQMSSQAKDDEYAMRNIVGNQVYELLIKITA